MNKYLDDFMKTFPYEGLTYDDVTLVTQYADFLPDDASLETKLTSRTTMKIPVISAAMDTVTEAPMAIAMALAGGIGVIHKNLEEDEQAKEVAKVKNYLNGLIAKPICFHADDDISFLRAEKKRMGLKFNGFPVLDAQDRLVGMITSSDMRFAPMEAKKLRDVMQPAPITSKPGTSLKKAYELMRAAKVGSFRSSTGMAASSASTASPTCSASSRTRTRRTTATTSTASGCPPPSPAGRATSRAWRSSRTRGLTASSSIRRTDTPRASWR